MYFYRARYYDPKVGRFVTKDPVGFKDGINLYAYVGTVGKPGGKKEKTNLNMWHQKKPVNLTQFNYVLVSNYIFMLLDRMSTDTSGNQPQL